MRSEEPYRPDLEADQPPKRKPRPRRLRARRRPLAVPQILSWADAHHARTGHWPKKDSGAVFEAPAETWNAIQIALLRGARGLSGRSSLAQLLAEHRGVPNHLQLPRLTERQVLHWADAFQKRTGRWPTLNDGRIAEAPRPGETWHHVDVALGQGCRGFPRGSSLARLLASARGARNRKALPRLTVTQILTWADAHRARTGAWPTRSSGSIPEAPLTETWARINSALSKPLRGLRRRSSLAQLLEKHRGVRNRMHLPPLRVKQILAWADAFRAKTGRWPNEKSGLIPDSNVETWGGVNAALRDGYRGLLGGTTLFRLLIERKEPSH